MSSPVSTKYFTVRVYHDNEYNDMAPFLAMRGITKKNARWILDRMKLAKQLKEEDRGFTGLNYRSGVFWIDHHEVGELFYPKSGQALTLSSRPDSLLEHTTRVECEWMHITDTHVYWSGYQKYTNDRCETDWLTKSHIQRVLAEV